MGQSAGKPPAAPDPSTILGLQNQYNRYNTQTPFGSTSWAMGPNGHETQTTSLSPQMQGAMDRAFSAAETPYTKEYVPQGMDQLASAMLGRVGSRYGLSGSGLNTNLQQQKPAQGAPQPPTMAGMGIQTQGSPMQTQMGLQANPGAMGGQMGSLGGMIGGGGMGLQTGMPQNALGAMSALSGMNSPMGMPQIQTQQPGQQPVGRMGI